MLFLLKQGETAMDIANNHGYSEIAQAIQAVMPVTKSQEVSQPELVSTPVSLVICISNKKYDFTHLLMTVFNKKCFYMCDLIQEKCERSVRKYFYDHLNRQQE